MITIDKMFEMTDAKMEKRYEEQALRYKQQALRYEEQAKCFEEAKTAGEQERKELHSFVRSSIKQLKDMNMNISEKLSKHKNLQNETFSRQEL